MWQTALAINSVLWAFATVYLIYSIGRGVILLDWKAFIIGLIVWLLITGLEAVLGMLSE